MPARTQQDDSPKRRPVGASTGITTESKKTTTSPRVLVLDIGGNNVKMKVKMGCPWTKFHSGRGLVVKRMMDEVRRRTARWEYDVVTVGYPGPVVFGHVVGDPPNLAPNGWVGYDFQAAFGRPTKVTNDAVLQALGSYRGGSMLFLGLGTGVGATMIVDGVIEQVPMDGLAYTATRGYDSYLKNASRRRMGNERWEEHVHNAVEKLKTFFEVDYVVIGGGNAKELSRVPSGAVLADPDAAFIGGRRMWEQEGARWEGRRSSTQLAAKDPVAAKIVLRRF